MNIYMLAVFALILIVAYVLKSTLTTHLKQLLLPSVCIGFILLLVVFSQTAVDSAANGIKLWLNVVFPSIFPFFIASELLYKTGFIKALGVLLEPIMRPLFNVPGCGSFALAMGLTSGYPVGAKITASMRHEDMLSKAEAERLLAFTNNSGPLFIIGAISIGMFNNSRIGFVLLLCHILACLSVGMLFRFHQCQSKQTENLGTTNIWHSFKKELCATKKINIGELLGEAIKNSINTMLIIGGFIILFSVIINLLLETGSIAFVSTCLVNLFSVFGMHSELITPTLSGFFEVTTGINMISKLNGISFIQQLTATSLILGWAGLSVHFQVYSIISKTDISIKPYIVGKLIQGILAALYLFVIMNWGMKSQSVFSYLVYIPNPTWLNYFIGSIKNITFSFIILIVLAGISLVIKKKHRSYTQT